MKGKLFFVGAGPGSLDLLTVRAARILQRADVVLHDELVPRDFVELLPPTAKVVNVGKRCGKPGPTQDDINALMIRYAKAGRSVVRLKCGDPSVFGRLGEEIEALTAAGIEFEIVPGITAALAAAAAARITLTDRRLASSVTFTTATLANGQQQDWSKFVQEKNTLVIYMPGRNYAALSEQLMAAGLARDLPCAVVARAGSYDEEIQPLTISELLAFHGATSPSVLIVGEAARRADHILAETADAAIPSEARDAAVHYIAAES